MQSLFKLTAVSLALLSGCATYDEVVVVGASKGDVIRQLKYNPGRDFAQLHFDANTKIEVFVPINTQSAAFSNPDVPSEILVFENVNRPSRCVSSQRASKQDGANLDCDVDQHRGDGRLLRAYYPDELAARFSAGDESIHGILAAAETYYANRDAFLKSLESAGLSAAHAKRIWDRRQKEQAWNSLNHYYEIQSYYYLRTCGEQSKYNYIDLCWDDANPLKFSELDLQDTAFYPFWEREYQRNQLVKSAAIPAPATSSTNQHESKVGANNKTAGSSSFSDSITSAMGEVIGQAIGLWLVKEIGLDPPSQQVGGISDEDLRKIEKAARDGARRAARQQQVQKNLNDMLKP